MSRKAAERHSTPGGFGSEPQLWVITRGREYKPRFQADRAVVIITAGQRRQPTIGVDPFVEAPRGSDGQGGAARHPQQQTAMRAQQRKHTHPLGCVLDLAPCADELFERTACEALYIVDYSPIAHDMPAEIAAPYPGRVAKPVGRLLQKLNVADAVVVADGADIALLYKVLPPVGDPALRAVVVRHPHEMSPTALRAMTAPGAEAATETPVRMACAKGTMRDAAADLACVFPNATCTEGLGGSDGAGGAGGGSGVEAAPPLTTLVCDAVAAVEAEDGVQGPPDWLTEHAPVFYQRVIFEHDRRTKQLVQRVEVVTEQVRAARAAAIPSTAEKRGSADNGAAAVVVDEAGARPAGTTRTSASPLVPLGSSVPAPNAVAMAPKTSANDTVPAAPRDQFQAAPIPAPSVPASSPADSLPPPVVYVAKRPFHPERFASLLRSHFTLTTESVFDDSERGPMTGLGSVDSIVAAADEAARVAASAAAAAARLSDSLRELSDPALLAASAVVLSSSTTAAAAATSAAGAARILSELISSTSTSMTTPSSLTQSSPSSLPRGTAAGGGSIPVPTGPFTGLTSSAGTVWIASRPTLCGTWTQPDLERPGGINIACGGQWDLHTSKTRPWSPLTATSQIPRTMIGVQRQELVFEGSEKMDHAAVRAALDECLLTEGELNEEIVGEETGADLRVMCFSPWPEQVQHLAALGVRLQGPGSLAIAQGSLNRRKWGAVGFKGGVKDGSAAALTAGMSKLTTGSGAASSSLSGETVGTAVTVQRPGGVASLSFGGKVGISRPEAFVAPPKGIDVKQFPEGTGHFWPKMPCLDCGSPWWLGDDWDAECANCGGDAESYDNNQQPHKEYRRRFERFRKLVEELVANR